MKTSSSVPPTFRFGVFELDPQAGELRKKGMKIRLQGQPVEILAMLLQRPGETITREELQKKLWPADTFVDFEQGLNNAMKRLRASLDDSAENPHFIETLPRHGYRFIGSVNGSEQTRAAEGNTTRSIRLRALGTVAVLAIAAGLVGLNVRGWRERLFKGAPKPQIQALAVLPLTNLSGDPEQEYFADGMTESLITELGKISSPRVISRQSVMQYKASKKSLREIAGELKVDAVLEGAVVRSGDRMRVTIHLSQAFPERQLWAEEYDRSIRDVLSLQGEIARAITDEIQVKLTPEERTRLAISRPVNPEAQDNYLRGLYFARNTELSFQTAIAHFKTAIEKDPTFAPAYAELAMAYFWLGNPDQGGPSARETLPQARAAVTKALQLDPSLARAHLALGLILLNSEWNWSGAEKQYRIALKLNPSCADCHFQYGVLLAGSGRNDEAIAQINQAIESDPLNRYYRSWLATIAFFSRQYDLSIKLSGNLDDDWTANMVALCFALKKMYPEAIAISEKAVARRGRQPGDLRYLALVYGLAGRKGETQKIIGELKERSRHHYVFPSVFAYAYLGLGDKDQALTYLERAYEEQDPALFWLKMSPIFDPLRSEPRFQALLRRVNFPQ